MKSSRSLTLRIIAIISFVATVVVNTLATTLPINGLTTADISDSYPNLFAPAGVTFAIWGVIYSLLALYSAYQIGAFSRYKTKLKAETVDEISLLFIVSGALNVGWIFMWHYLMIAASVPLMLALLVVLIRINLLIAKQKKLSRVEQITVRAPFSIYFGWITVATIANITTLLVSINWDGWGISEELWTVAILIVGAVIGVAAMLRQNDWLYGAVLVWAYWGILAKHTADTGWQGKYGAVIATLCVAIPLFLGAMYAAYQQEKRAKMVWWKRLFSR